MEFQAELASTLRHNTDQKYSCENCPAKCCRLPWQIALTSEEVERYQSIPWIVERLQAAGTQFMQTNGQAVLPRVKRNDGDSACVFLDDDNLCSMQKQEGHSFIPFTCQEYPFGATQNTSNGQTVHQLTASFACRSILYNYGEPLDKIADAKYQSLQDHQRIKTMPDALYIGKIRVTQEQYLNLLKAGESFFRRPDLSAAQGLLLAQSMLLEIVENTDKQNQVSDEIVQAAIDLAKQALPQDLNPGTTESNALVANTFITFNLLRFLDEENGEQGQLAKIKTFISLLQQNGTYRFWDFPKAVSLKEANRIPVPETSPDVQAQLKRYYASLFFNRTAFFKNTDLLQSILLVAASYPTILKMARLHALAHDRSTALLEDLMEGIGYTDICLSSIGSRANTLLGKAFQLILSLLAGLPDTYIRVLYSESY